MTLKSFQGYETGNWSSASDDGERSELEVYTNIQISFPLSLLSLLKYAWPNGLIIGSQEAQKHSSPSLWVVWILVLPSYGVDMSTWGEDEGKRKSLAGACCWCLEKTFSFCNLFIYFFWPFLPLHTQTHIHLSIFSSLPTMFLIIVCLLTFVIRGSHPWWYPRVLGHGVCLCACVSEDPRETPHTYNQWQGVRKFDLLQSPYFLLVGVESPPLSESNRPLWILLWRKWKVGKERKRENVMMDFKWQKMSRHCPHQTSTGNLFKY